MKAADDFFLLGSGDKPRNRLKSVARSNFHQIYFLTEVSPVFSALLIHILFGLMLILAHSRSSGCAYNQSLG
ncbi:MAG: hypothetical protein CM15mP125_0520 [Gammaproteobacteria bacterium]|nr:MAG: hypothetical protein CM15mP125_0520 [Gammaproteobacteria bacterium]